MCAGALASTSVTVPSAPVAQAETSPYKFTEGNIQFTVPAGWELKSEKGSVTVSPKADSSTRIIFAAVPDAIGLNADERERLLNSLIDKQKSADVKLGNYTDNETIGGIRYAVRPFTGSSGGRDVHGMYMLLGVVDKEAPVEKYVFIAASSLQGAGESVDKDMDTILHSLKRAE